MESAQPREIGASLGFGGHCIVALILGLIGSIIIWRIGTETVIRTETFWVPAKVRYANDVDGTFLPLTAYSTGRPVATMPFKGFERFAKDRNILVTVSETCDDSNYHCGARTPAITVHYVTTVNDVQYYSLQKFNWARADSSTWSKDGVITFTGYLFGWALAFCIAWVVFSFYICLQGYWLEGLYAAALQRFKKL